MSQLSHFQDQFLAVLYGNTPDQILPSITELLTQPGFSVYQNNLFKACIEALRDNFPTVEYLSGEAFFTATAQCYVRETPPVQTELIHYGQDFPDFLARFPALQNWPYIPAVARVDALWLNVFSARESPALKAEDLRVLPLHALETLALRPRPCIRWLWSDSYPLYRLWHDNRNQLPMPGELVWQGEGVLLIREQGQIQAHRLSQAGALFLDACATGDSLQQASEKTMAVTPQTDFSPLLHDLLTLRVFQQPSAEPIR